MPDVSRGFGGLGGRRGPSTPSARCWTRSTAEKPGQLYDEREGDGAIRRLAPKCEPDRSGADLS
jgi:hypothetical protein